MAEPSRRESLVDREKVVLVVDDEEDICAALRSALTRRLRGVRVLTATSPQKGLEMLASEPVDAIVCDYKMPGMTGLEFLAKARAGTPGAARIMMTAFPEDSIAIQAINELRLEHFLTKPFSLESAVEVVDRVLAEKRSQDAQNAAFARTLELMRRASVTGKS